MATHGPCEENIVHAWAILGQLPHLLPFMLIYQTRVFSNQNIAYVGYIHVRASDDEQLATISFLFSYQKHEKKLKIYIFETFFLTSNHMLPF